MKSKTSEIEGKTILVVDDEPSILEFVTLVLANSGYRIITADSGEEALELSRSRKEVIHLLLSNIQMKGMTGIELGTKISAERPEMQVLLMSGFTAGMLVLNDGWQFLHKPFIPAQLRALVAGTLAKTVGPDPTLNEHSLSK